MRLRRIVVSLGIQISIVLLIAALARSARAQELGTAVLSGDVTDPQGAVVSGASASAEHKATGLRRTTLSGAAGLFVLNNLAPGLYEVRVEASGFAPFVRQVRLEVGQQTDLRIHLRLAAQVEKIVIDDTDNTPPVNTVSSVVDGVISLRQIDNLPLNGRNFLELALLMPGNSPAPNFDPTKASTVVISSAGQMGRGGNVTIDGADDNDDVVGGMLLNVPEDAVQEFQIATNRFSAEVGRSGSSVVNVVTKAGTNDLHGSASFYERDKRLQALPATLDPGAGVTPPFRRQQYSGTLGGPLVRSKAWWYGAFEYRDELGGVQVGTRQFNAATLQGTILKSFAAAPAKDLLGTIRGDWQISNQNTLNLRYSVQRQDATTGSSFSTALGSASERQDAKNNFQALWASWTRVLSPTLVNRASFSVNNFINNTDPITAGPELDFPSLTDGTSFRVPQQTRQNRLEWSEGLDWVHGQHNFHFGGDFQRIDADFNLGVFQTGRIIMVEDFPDFDRSGDGIVNDNDLLFAVSLRSAFPTQPLVIPSADNNHVAAYAQDDWHLHPQFTLNLGLRYEIDTDVKDLGHYSQINPLVTSFLQGNRHKDANNFAPRVGFNWATKAGKFSLHGGYGIYYDRITLEIVSLERGLDGRALPIEVRAGNVTRDPMGIPIFLDSTGHFVTGAPTFNNPFTGFIFPGAGAGGINIIDNRMQNPEVQQFDLGIQWQFLPNWVVRADGIHDLGTHFIIGRAIGTVFNPVVGGPDVVKNLESSVNTHYDGLLLTVDHRFAQRYQFHTAYTLSKSLNYANDDQIPFSNGPIDPNDLRREYGPAPNDQRHRLVLAGVVDLPYGFRISPLWTIASGVPMDILLPDGSSRVPELGRNAGGRVFHTGAELNSAITTLNLQRAVDDQLPLVNPGARFNDSFNSFDLRVSKDFHVRERCTIQALAEAFNLFNVTNILGVSVANYSGFSNTLGPNFGQPVRTAGGVFGSGGPRAFQLGAKLTF